MSPVEIDVSIQVLFDETMNRTLVLLCPFHVGMCVHLPGQIEKVSDQWLWCRPRRVAPSALLEPSQESAESREEYEREKGSTKRAAG